VVDSGVGRGMLDVLGRLGGGDWRVRGCLEVFSRLKRGHFLPKGVWHSRACGVFADGRGERSNGARSDPIEGDSHHGRGCPTSHALYLSGCHFFHHPTLHVQQRLRSRQARRTAPPPRGPTPRKRVRSSPSLLQRLPSTGMQMVHIF
jgi:hypothetical protein